MEIINGTEGDNRNNKQLCVQWDRTMQMQMEMGFQTSCAVLRQNTKEARPSLSQDSYKARDVLL